MWGGVRLLTPLEAVGKAASAAADKKAHHLVVLNVGPFLAITDYFLLASGGSERQVKTIAEEVEAKLAKEKRKPIRREGSPDGGWVILDYGDFVVHIFSDEMREYYDLERLWKDAERPQLPELEEAVG